MKYRFTGYKKFLDPEGYPAIAPPWGTLNAINLNTGEYAWKIPLGEYPELAAKGLKNTGSENYGGPDCDRGRAGVYRRVTNFDRKFRAFDKSTGELLWETTLPFSGNATPATYEVDGRQYVVIAAGGGKDPKQGSGGIYVAFALPRAASDLLEDGRPARPAGRDARPPFIYSTLSDTQREIAVTIFRGETRTDSATSQFRNPGITSVLPLSKPR